VPVTLLEQRLRVRLSHKITRPQKRYRLSGRELEQIAAGASDISTICGHGRGEWHGRYRERCLQKFTTSR
jgi:hypothetical protein